MSSGERLTLLCFNALFAKWCLICFYALRGLWGCMWGTWKLLPWEPDKEIFQQPTWDPAVISLAAQRHGDALRVQRVPGRIRLLAPCPDVCLPPQQWERFWSTNVSLSPPWDLFSYDSSTAIALALDMLVNTSLSSPVQICVELWYMHSSKPFLAMLMPSAPEPCGSKLTEGTTCWIRKDCIL